MTWAAAGALTLALLAAGFVMGMLTERWQAERDEFDRQIAGYEDRLAKNRAPQPGRHRASQPRDALPLSPAAGPGPDATSLVRSGYRDTWFQPGRIPLATTAADIFPVIVPDPDRMRPQPAPDLAGADDTGRMPAIDFRTADTGALKALTDEEFMQALAQ